MIFYSFTIDFVLNSITLILKLDLDVIKMLLYIIKMLAVAV